MKTTENIPINVELVVKHWLDSSDRDFNVMLSLYQSKTYNWALFLGHISMEKLLKAYYVKRKKHMRRLHITCTGWQSWGNSN